MRIAVFASGNGSNFEAIVRAGEKGLIDGEIALLFCDKAKAKVIDRAKKHNIPYFLIEKQKEQTKENYEKQIVDLLETENIDFIVLAGYMKILGSVLLNKFPQKIINLHPSLLPKFPGNKSILEAYASSEAETGITIHLVDEGVDTGPIIYQEAIPINRTKSLKEFKEDIHDLEHRALPKVLNTFILEERERFEETSID